MSKSALQSVYLKPEHRRRLPLAAFPLVDDGLAGRADLGGQLLLTEAESVPKSD